MRRASTSLLAAALLVGACSSTTLATTGTTPDAAADVAPDDATQPDAATPPDVATRPDAPDADAPVDASDADDAPPMAGPLNGTWRVVDIVCNGAPGSDAARLYITPPNSSSFVVRGDRSTYTSMTSTCALTLDSDVAYPSPGHAVFTARGPFACMPARCSPSCGTTPTLPYSYEYVQVDERLMMTTVGATPDVTCTAYGQSNPIRYTYERM